GTRSSGTGVSFLGPGFATRTVPNKGLVQPMESRAKPVQPHWHNKDGQRNRRGRKKRKRYDKAHRNLIEHIVAQNGNKTKAKEDMTRSGQIKATKAHTECPVLTSLMR
ncbi:unnamed protein product, partial [Musa hybrid cultivar]